MNNNGIEVLNGTIGGAMSVKYARVFSLFYRVQYAAQFLAVHFALIVHNYSYNKTQVLCLK